MRKAAVPRLVISEKAWSAQVAEIAAICGYELRFRDNATNAPRRCPKCKEPIHLPRNRRGFLDWVLVRTDARYGEPRLIFSELKVGANTLTEDQRAWLDALMACGQEAYVWYPEQAQEVADILRMRTRYG